MRIHRDFALKTIFDEWVLKPQETFPPTPARAISLAMGVTPLDRVPTNSWEASFFNGQVRTAGSQLSTWQSWWLWKIPPHWLQLKHDRNILLLLSDGERKSECEGWRQAGGRRKHFFLLKMQQGCFMWTDMQQILISIVVILWFRSMSCIADAQQSISEPPTTAFVGKTQRIPSSKPSLIFHMRSVGFKRHVIQHFEYISLKITPFGFCWKSSLFLSLIVGWR